MTDSPLAVQQKANADLVTFDSTIPPASYADAVGIAETEADAHVILDQWEALNQDKSALVNHAFVIEHLKFMTDTATGANYVNAFVIRDDDRLYRVTDGSTGFYAQCVTLVQKRLADGHPHPYGPYIIDNGLRESEYGVDKNGKAVPLGDPTQVGKGSTYYIA